METPYDLERFVAAQEPVIERVLDELRGGRKRSHWMWFVFPQIVGLGHSPMAQRYAIGSRDEAGAYLKHPVLGPRLFTCTDLVISLERRSAHDILGSPDDRKFHSSMTLFETVPAADAVFSRALQKYFSGTRDSATLARL